MLELLDVAALCAVQSSTTPCKLQSPSYSTRILNDRTEVSVESLDILVLGCHIWKVEMLESQKLKVIFETDLDNTCKNFQNYKMK